MLPAPAVGYSGGVLPAGLFTVPALYGSFPYTGYYPSCVFT